MSDPVEMIKDRPCGFCSGSGIASDEGDCIMCDGSGVAEPYHVVIHPHSNRDDH